MRIAITGGTGFVGRHLAERLLKDGHQVVLLARGLRHAESQSGATFVSTNLGSVETLREAFAGCDAVAHCAGINREVGDQRFKTVHVDGTRNVIEAARMAGVRKISLMSFLRARPSCGSPYHESKWAAEELVRNSGMDYTIVKAGMVYGRGDHMLDHLSHSLHTFPLFATVGFVEKGIHPLAIHDLTDVLVAGLVDGRLPNCTVALVGAEELLLSDAVRDLRQPSFFCERLWRE